jgi:hypothetical protein
MSKKNLGEALLAAHKEHHHAMIKAHTEALARPGGDKEFHKACLESHIATGAKLAECEKAMQVEFAKRANQLAPTDVSSVYAVPRPGQPGSEGAKPPQRLETMIARTANVPLEFAKLAAIEDDELGIIS